MRKAVKRRILIFSGSAAVGTVFVALGALAVFQVLLPFVKLGETNRQTLERIHCVGSDVLSEPSHPQRKCDIRELKNDWELDAPDFVLLKPDRLFITSNPQYKELWLNFSDPEFIRQFRDFRTWESPTGEVWRLYAETRELHGEPIDIMVGERERAPWLMVEERLTPEVDQKLKTEVSRIATRLTWEGNRVEARRINSNADAWEIVESRTGRVIRWNGEIPAVLPQRQLLLQRRIGVLREGLELFLIRGDENEDVALVSVSAIGNLGWLATVIVVIATGVFLLAYVAGSEWLRRYFNTEKGRPVSIEKALESGEGPSIEFKHGLSEDAVLKAITAFANTEGGTLFIGVDDEGRVRGLDLPTAKARDEFKHRVFVLIRERIQPCPIVELEFEKADEAIVARLFVHRGEEPLYYLRGVSYIRHGESNIIPRPEQVRHILMQYAF